MKRLKSTLKEYKKRIKNKKTDNKVKIYKRVCNCIGSNGEFKILYLDLFEALEIENRDTHLRVYQCPNTKGWHLTKVI